MEENFGNGLWIFALLILLFGFGNGGFFGGNRGPAPATQEGMTAGFNNQATQSQLQQIALSSANNNYETAQLIYQQTNALNEQNNTNLINAIQGFNSLGLQIQNQTNVLSQQLQAIAAQQEACCCAIKTQMLQYRLDDRDVQLATARNDISNLQQTQYILGQLGRFVPWAGSGAVAGAVSGS